MQHRAFLCRAAALSGVLAGALAAPLPASAAQALSYGGTVGTARVGLTVTLPPGNRDGALSGHYFYARYQKDIPLTGSLTAGRITLTEPGGGAFMLGFADGGGTSMGSAGKPLGFRNSTGLQGTWVGKGRNLPVTLLLASGAQDVSAPASAGKAVAAPPAPPSAAAAARRYAQVTTESDTAFEARVQGFRNAVIQGDRAGASRYVQFLLRVNAVGKTHTVASAIQLGSAWDRIATPPFVEAMKKATPRDLFVSNGMAMIGDGIAWFGPRGAVALNLP